MKKVWCLIATIAVMMMTGCERWLFLMMENARPDEPEIDKEAVYTRAEAYEEEGNIAKAAITFGSVADYEDAAERSGALWDELLVRQTLCAGNAYTIGVSTSGHVELAGDLDNVFHKYGYESVNGWTDVTEVAAGNDFVVGLKDDGKIVISENGVWNDWASDVMTHIVTVDACDEVVIGLRRDGTVVSVGRYGWSQTEQWTDIVNVCSGGNRLFGVTADGRVCFAGEEKYGNGDVEDWTNIMTVDASKYHTVGLKNDGTVVAVGLNSNGQCDVAQWTDIVAISVGANHTLGLKSDGTVVAAGLNLTNQCAVGGWRDIVAISAGASHSVGLKSDGTVIATLYTGYEACNVSDWDHIAAP